MSAVDTSWPSRMATMHGRKIPSVNMVDDVVSSLDSKLHCFLSYVYPLTLIVIFPLLISRNIMYDRLLFRCSYMRL